MTSPTTLPATYQGGAGYTTGGNAAADPNAFVTLATLQAMLAAGAGGGADTVARAAVAGGVLATKIASLTPSTTSSAPTAQALNLYDATAGNLAPPLPLASSVAAGVVIGIKKTDAGPNLVTATCSGSDHIGSTTGSTSIPVRTLDQIVWLASDGTSVWSKISGDLGLPALSTLFTSAKATPSVRRVSLSHTGAVPPTKWAADGSKAQQIARQRLIRPLVGGRNVEISFPTVQGIGEATVNGDGSTITYSAAIEWPAGVLHPAFSRDGASTVTAAPNGSVPKMYVPGFDVPAAADMPAVGQAGAFPMLRVRAVTSSTGGLPAGIPTNGVDEWTGTGSAQPDVTRTTGNDIGVNSNYGINATVTYEPYSVVPCVGIANTSIEAGKGDPSLVDKDFYNSAAPGGWAMRALSSDGQSGRAGTLAFHVLQLSVSGETYANLASTLKSHLRRQLLDEARCSTLLLGGPVNDLGNGLAALQAAYLAVATMAAARGVRVIGFTMTPVGLVSTDGFITPAGMTVGSNEATRRTANQWIRAKMPIDPTTKAAVGLGTAGALLAGQTGHPFTAVVDVASALETATDSGILLGAAQTVTDASIASGQAVVTCANSAPFTADRRNESVAIPGAGAGGTVLVARILTVAGDGKSATVDTNAGTPVNGGTAGVATVTQDGIHPTPRGHKLMAAAAAAAVPLIV